MKRVWVYRGVVVAVVILLVGGIAFCKYKMPVSITTFFDNNPGDVSRVDVRNGSTGDLVSITDETQIKQLTDYLSTLSLQRCHRAKSTGYLYSVTFYNQDEALIQLIEVGSYYKINRGSTYYKATTSSDKTFNELVGSILGQ